jgi:hypothetical protein
MGFAVLVVFCYILLQIKAGDGIKPPLAKA